jgi:hypothetical protein
MAGYKSHGYRTRPKSERRMTNYEVLRGLRRTVNRYLNGFRLDIYPELDDLPDDVYSGKTVDGRLIPVSKKVMDVRRLLNDHPELVDSGLLRIGKKALAEATGMSIKEIESTYMHDEPSDTKRVDVTLKEGNLGGDFLEQVKNIQRQLETLEE